MKVVSKIIIYYFSGTGNAKQVAKWFCQFATEKEIDCELVNIEEIREINDISPETLLMIISPIHGFNYPKITLNFIGRFPRNSNRVVLMNTRAGMKIGRWVTPGLTGIAFLLSSLILKRKGYRIVGLIPFDMPSNWLSIHPALNTKTVKYLHEKNYDRVRRHADKVFSGKRDFLALRDIIQDLLIAPVSIGYYLFGRFAFAKSFYASNKCDNCGLCIKKCPVNAIESVDGRPYWTFDCESCMRCMNFCPIRAIETAHGLFTVISIFSSLLMTTILHSIAITYFHSGLARLTIFTIIFFALLWILYALQHRLLASSFAGKLIARTSLTFYRFWGRYRSISDEKLKKQ
jgi:ferredoxin